jgi:hypothetical protein
LRSSEVSDVQPYPSRSHLPLREIDQYCHKALDPTHGYHRVVSVCSVRARVCGDTISNGLTLQVRYDAGIVVRRHKSIDHVQVSSAGRFQHHATMYCNDRNHCTVCCHQQGCPVWVYELGWPDSCIVVGSYKSIDHVQVSSAGRFQHHPTMYCNACIHCTVCCHQHACPVCLVGFCSRNDNLDIWRHYTFLVLLLSTFSPDSRRF